MRLFKKKAPVTKNNIIVHKATTTHYMDYIREAAEQLPQFEIEGEQRNHKHAMKKIYKLQGMPGILKYIKVQWVIYRSIERKQHRFWIVRTFWKWYYEIAYNL